MSRTIRARKDKQKPWWKVHRHYTGWYYSVYSGEWYDNTMCIGWRDETRKPVSWAVKVSRDGYLSKSYRAYEQHYGRQCFRADEKAQLDNWEFYDDEDVLFPVHKSYRRCKTFWWWWD